MYSVKQETTRQLKSWHQETPAGLNAAIEECEMRTHATGQPHIVTDNHGLRLHLSLPKEVKQRIKEERAAKRDFNGWLISLFAAAVWILCIVWRR